ncbi:hypothetical protein SCP_0601230 [Sparassis crispa]|uniref:AttH domain-containing protein n=1 Tax=Sparassis crispa TaxID=139825 RepID=A0A401GPI9_9APHY|nr:hypothetical protein SCP_0601230 [Sparassis crispa]GBE84145.1 hypothetical protein SCP_0601230 [Sparassis crispa]
MFTVLGAPMFRVPATVVFVAALWASYACAAALHGHRPVKDTVPFDGQYLAANSSNTQTEWWYIQGVSEPVGDESPSSVVVVFYQGNVLYTAPAGNMEPEFTISISGFLSNGTTYNVTIPTTTGTITTDGQAVDGTWGTAGKFFLSSDLNTFTVELNSPEYGMSGSIVLTSSASPHYACNVTDDPYFDTAVPAGVSLSPTETALFTEFGWAVTIPGGQAVVDLLIDGTPLQFIGNGYHDHNFSPAAIFGYASQWQWLQAQVGPYVLTGAIMQAINSTLIANTGYLAESGVVVQNQCSLVGSRRVDFNSVTPYGASFDNVTGAVVPQGFLLDYTLEDGEQYSFNLTTVGTFPDTPIYYRWIGTATGGKVGGVQYTGTTIHEWLDPSLSLYTPSQ